MQMYGRVESAEFLRPEALLSLRGELRDRGRHVRHLMPGLREVNAPRKRRGLAPTTPRGEAALPPYRLTERDARRERVGRLPEREPVASHEEDGRQEPAEEAAVPDAARAQEVYREKVAPVRPVLRLREH